jgi:hypothetical protein
MKYSLFWSILLFAHQFAYADLANALSCHKNISDKQCSSLLIGQIDALSNLGVYCPDGNTSYGLITAAWARDMKLDPASEKNNTTENLIKTLRKLNLVCKGK